MKKRLSLLLAAAFVVSTMAAPPVVAQDGPGGRQVKVCVKHKTGSKKNPRTFVSVATKASLKAHKRHGDVVVADALCERARANR